MTKRRLKEILSEFKDVSVLVIGDYYLDAYWMIDKKLSTLSLETPWHTNPVVDKRYSPGAAGTVTNNLNALGAGKIYTLGVIGEDEFGMVLSELLEKEGKNTDFMISSSNRVTPTYLKPMHQGYEGIETEGSRFDIENHSPLPEDLEEKVIDNLRQCVPLVDAVIVGDQMSHANWGVITDKVREEICRLAGKYDEKLFFVDSRERIGLYHNLIIKPNRFEAMRAVNPDWEDEDVSLDEAKKCGEKLHERTGKPIYITIGERGILVLAGEEWEHVPGIPLDCPIDPVGAGDSVSSGIVLTLCSGATHQEAAFVGNLVASVTITKIGTTGTASHRELLSRMPKISEI